MTAPTRENQLRIAALMHGDPSGYRPAVGGYTPAERWTAQVGAKRFFVKIATNDYTAGELRREAQSYRVIYGPFMPEFLGFEDHETQPMLLLEDLRDAHWPPVWTTAHVDAVLRQIEAIHNTKADVAPFADVHGAKIRGWDMVAEDPTAFLSLGLVTPEWLDRAIPDLLEQDKRCVIAGAALSHWDIRSDNIAILPGGAKLVDWNNTCLSNPAFDLGGWLPSLAAEGGPLPESILPDAPDVATFVSGYFAARAGQAPMPDAPRVRLVQHQQLLPALAWVIRALGLLPADGAAW